jgi:hypothetical protein
MMDERKKEAYTLVYSENYGSESGVKKSYTLFFEQKDKEVTDLSLEDLKVLRNLLNKVLDGRRN